MDFQRVEVIGDTRYAFVALKKVSHARWQRRADAGGGLHSVREFGRVRGGKGDHWGGLFALLIGDFHADGGMWT